MQGEHGGQCDGCDCDEHFAYPVSDLKSALLLHHKIGNISDVYASPAAMHQDLVAQQELISEHMLGTANALN